jgi:hypothetical protein
MIKKSVIILILLIPLLILLPGWNGFVYSPQSAYSDLSISHYPNALFLIDSLRSGQFPLWAPTILGGYPFAADPLAGLWYLPGWLAYLFPLPMGFNLMVLLHLWFSGIGMWLFLRGSGLDPFACLAGAIAWELLPKTFAHFGAGHLTLIYAVSWTPWLILAEQKFPNGKKSLLSGLVLGLIAQADIRWAAYSGLLWLIFCSQHRVFENAQGFFRSRLFSLGKHLAASILLAVLIAAPLILPLIQYTQLSTRSMMQVSDNLALSLSPLYLFSLVAPTFQGYAEWTVYSGGLAIIALIWTLTQPKLRQRMAFWLIVIAGALWMAMGSNIPLNGLLARLPGMDLLRVPSRFMLIFGFGAVVVIAHFIQANLCDAGLGKHFWGNLLTFGITIFTWIVAVGLWAITLNPPWMYLWGASALTVSVALVGLRNSGKITQYTFQGAALILILLDVGSVAASNFTYRSPDQVLSQGADAATLISAQPGVFRIYTPSDSIPQQTAARYHLQMVNGVDPLQLSVLANFMEPASGVPFDGYSVTIPPFAHGDPSSDNRSYIPDAAALGLLNVRFVVASFPLQSQGLLLWNMLDHTYIYENKNWRARVWMQPEVAGSVNITTSSPNEIFVNAEGPGTLVLSEINYPGWEVTVDGNPQKLLTVDHLLRGVELTSGSHSVKFTFRPGLVFIGIGLAALAWISIGIYWRFLGK